jgi:quinol monooxygenase YgiN
VIFNVVRQPVRAKYADEFPSLIADYIAASRAEPGNLFFDWYRSADDPNLWVLIEGFRDAAAGEAHVSSDHFKAAMSDMPRLLAAAPEIIHVDDVPGEGWGQVSEGA